MSQHRVGLRACVVHPPPTSNHTPLIQPFTAVRCNLALQSNRIGLSAGGSRTRAMTQTGDTIAQGVCGTRPSLLALIRPYRQLQPLSLARSHCLSPLQSNSRFSRSLHLFYPSAYPDESPILPSPFSSLHHRSEHAVE